MRECKNKSLGSWGSSRRNILKWNFALILMIYLHLQNGWDTWTHSLLCKGLSFKWWAHVKTHRCTEKGKADDIRLEFRLKKSAWKSSGKKISDCTIGKFGVPFQSCNRRSFWPQMENTTCCYRSAASLCTQAAYDHRLAGRLKLICSTAVPHRALALQFFTWPQLLRFSVLICTSLGPSHGPQQSFLGIHGSWPKQVFLALFHKEKKRNTKISKPYKWSWTTKILQNICPHRGMFSCHLGFSSLPQRVNCQGLDVRGSSSPTGFTKLIPKQVQNE